MNQLSIPALNKWTTVSPSATIVAAMQHFCGVFPRVFNECYPSKPCGRCSSSSSEQDEGAALGQPIDQTKVWRKLARKRQRKAAMFLADPDSCFRTLLWAVVTGPVMRIHFALFKRATWLSERVQPDSDEEDDLSSTAAFISSALSPARKCISLLGAALADPCHQLWLPLQDLYSPLSGGPRGSVLSWPQDKLRTTRRCVLTLTGQMWRKLIETWERYPWRLTDLLQGSAEEQVEKAKEVCAKPPCCLDSFTAKLAKQYGPEVLAGEEAKVFLKAVFDRVLPTSTYVERMFARLARWTETKEHNLHLSQLCAKHFTNTFSSIVETWRGKARKSGIIARVRNNKERPSWVKGGRQQQCSTGLHICSQDFLVQNPNPPGGQDESGEERLARALRAWQVLPVQERQHWKRVAKSQNRNRRTAAHPVFDLVGGPWNAASSHGFPLSRHIVMKYMDKRKEIAEQQRATTNLLQPENLDSMDIWPECPYSLFARCSSRSCVSAMTDCQKNLFDTLVKLVIHGIMSFAPLPLSATEEPMLLSFASWAVVMSSSSFRVERSSSGSRAWAVQANMRALRGLCVKFKV